MAIQAASTPSTDRAAATARWALASSMAADFVASCLSASRSMRWQSRESSAKPSCPAEEASAWASRIRTGVPPSAIEASRR